MSVPVPVAYLRLVDAAPLVIARELGLAEAEGLDLDLVSAPSWSVLRDMLNTGAVDAAQMLSPLPVAMALGLGGAPGSVEALQVLSVNGNAIGVSDALAARMGPVTFGDARGAGAALLAAAKAGPIRIGVPFPFSMHMELLRYWIEGCGDAPEGAIQVRTVPPPMMAEALAADDIDAFCVGEPWGSDAVDRGLARLILPGRSIWAFAPEKVLAARTGWAEREPAVAGGLMRALHRAAAWLSQPDNLSTASDVLARPDMLGLPAETVERALRGRIAVDGGGTRHDVPGFLELHRGAAAFPWRSQGAWIADRLARRHGLDPVAAQAAGRRVFRSDLYRLHLGALAPDLPGASEKLEGAMAGPTPVASRRGALTLMPDAFFDGAIFEPNESR